VFHLAQTPDVENPRPIPLYYGQPGLGIRPAGFAVFAGTWTLCCGDVPEAPDKQTLSLAPGSTVRVALGR
jgi:hypothetical protein